MTTPAKVFALVIMLALAGCDDGPIASSPVVDQCMRAELFQSCMKSLPAGPVATQYNDWDEVVDSCSSAAYYQALRQREHIKPECQP